MKRLVLPLLLLAPFSAHAQSIQTQIDSGVAQVTRIVSSFGSEIAQQAATIQQLQTQLNAVTAERDAMKKADDAKKPDPPKAP